MEVITGVTLPGPGQTVCEAAFNAEMVIEKFPSPFLVISSLQEVFDMVLLQLVLWGESFHG